MSERQKDDISNNSLREVASVFLRLGCLGFGGPLVHIAMMEEEIVQKRRWMSGEHFLDLVGATNLIPGPNSTEMTMHCGHERAGWKGLVVAGMCFILPAVIITGIIAWAYQRYGSLPDVQIFFYGIKPAILAIVSALMISLGRRALKSVLLGLLGLLAAVAALAGVNEIVVLFTTGFLGVLLRKRSANMIVPVAFIADIRSVADVSNWKLFFVFVKIGALLYGSGYVLFAFLDAELVARGWLHKDVLIDAIAVGQFTPGPVFSSATFVGWQIGGFWGAVAATIGIFLPSFLFVGLLNPLIPRLRKSPAMSAFLDAVNVASVAVILVVIVEMGLASVNDWKTVLIALLAFGVTFYFKNINTALVILGGAVFGYVLSFV